VTNTASYDYTAYTSSLTRERAGQLTVSFGTNATAVGGITFSAPAVLDVPETYNYDDMPVELWAHTDSCYASDTTNGVSVEITGAVTGTARAVYNEFFNTLYMAEEGVINWTNAFKVWSTNEFASVP